MNKSKLHLLRNMAALLLCASAASCSQDDMPQTGGTPLPDGKYPLSLTATVGTPQTRAGGKDQWLGGEEIAVSIGDYTGKYTMDANGKATAAGTPYYWQNTTPATVSAWFPYDAQTNVDISDQSQGYAAFDFLYAETEGSYAAPVQLAFSHQMAKVSYTLQAGDGITDEDLKGATVQIAGYTKASFSEGILTGTDDGWITPASDNEALLVPQNMTGKPLIKVSVSDNDFIYTPVTGNLQAGYLYTFTITVKVDGIEVTSVNGGEWNDGGSVNVNSYVRYIASDLKLGDYYYADGTWSDGGLRKLYSDGTMEWEETTPQSESGKTCIGIVFHVGQHETDQSDYSKPLTEDGPTIPDGVFHDYVVALTDVNDDSSDQLRWEYDPKNEYNQVVGTSTSTSDWQGYSNSLKFHEFVNNDDNKAAGWVMNHFPAALACETYGNRTTDRDGNPADGKYDWQQPLAAPQNTSGWFLPSLGQLKYLYQNHYFLSSRMTNVKKCTMNDCNYKNYIKGFNTSFLAHYWSSTEDSSNYPNYAWGVRFRNGDCTYGNKNNGLGVRAVLAF